MGGITRDRAVGHPERATKMLLGLIKLGSVVDPDPPAAVRRHIAGYRAVLHYRRGLLVYKDAPATDGVIARHRAALIHSHRAKAYVNTPTSVVRRVARHRAVRYREAAPTVRNAPTIELGEVVQHLTVRHYHRVAAFAPQASATEGSITR